MIYNKAAMVLHMLRRLVGDEAFFRGIRGFYAEWRFSKAGTDDFRAAMKRASGQDLPRSSTRGSSGTVIPRLQVRHTVAGRHCRRDHSSNAARSIPVPVSITLAYTNGATEHLTIAGHGEDRDPQPPAQRNAARARCRPGAALAVFEK